MTRDEDVVALRAENAALRVELSAALEVIAQLRERVAALEERPPPAPSFVRANRPVAPEKTARTKRAPEHNRGRRREEPTRIVDHALKRCPACAYLLRGQSVARTRQVIELPEPAGVVITEHRLLKRHCPVCERWWTPQVDFSAQVLGQGRLGVRLVSLIAYLRQVARLPVRQIQAYLHALHGLQLSVGAIDGVLDRLCAATAAERAALLATARASPVAHIDETGWRENGHNGYVWGLVTPGPDPVCYYTYDRSRAGAVAATLLGGFAGHLVTDYYCAYNQLGCKHQRCWVHLLRDLHALKEAHATDAAVVAWARAVRALYDDAQAALDPQPLCVRLSRRGVSARMLVGRPLSTPQRAALARQLEAQAFRLGVRYAGVKGHPARALARRLLRHQGELFPFVRVDGLDADNNRAERLLRPVVVQRKISGGTRSAQGSATRLGLASLFETWHARGLNPFQECLSLLHSR